MALLGYDISNNQGDIDNRIVRGDFVVIKATEGVGYTDPNCDANYQQSKAAGKLLGVYHFARPDGNDPISEANWFVSQVGGYLGEAVLVLDFETNPLDPSWAKQFLDRVYDLTKVRAWIYMNQSCANSHDWSAVWPNYALWLAQYGANTPTNGYETPNITPSANGDWTFVGWQFTSQGHLGGWGGSLDLDEMYIDAAGWHKYAVGDRDAPAPAPAPAPSPAPVETPAPVVEPPTPVVVSTQPTPVVITPVVEPTPAPVAKPKPKQQNQPSWIESVVSTILTFISHVLKNL